MKLSQLFEARNTTGVLKPIVSYLEKKLGIDLIEIPGVEEFSNSKQHGFGIRFIEAGSTRCIRFNWASKNTAGSSTDIQSIDIFNGGTRDPNFTVSPDGISLVKVLPQLVGILEKPKVEIQLTFPVAMADALKEEFITEANRNEWTAESALADFIKQLAKGKSFTRTDFIVKYHISKAGIFDTLIEDFEDRLIINGKRVSLASDTDLEELESDVLAKAGFIEVSQAGSGETYATTEAEAQIQKIPFKETLENLEGLVKALIKGSFNALFVSGKGGVGKTQTVEDALHAEGLVDGDGYFKNTGSASAAGMFTTLYHHRKDIILFDDSDGALNDQDARNLIKAATDTKKNRKLVWNKKSSFIYDPDDPEAESFEEDLNLAPKYFDFQGRIIFVSNLPIDRLDPDGALRTRAFLVDVNPTQDEILDQMKEILYKINLEGHLSMTNKQRDEVYEIVKESKNKNGVTLRTLVRALNLAASGAPNYKKLIELYA